MFIEDHGFHFKFRALHSRHTGSTVSSGTLYFVDWESAEGRRGHFLGQNQRYNTKLQNTSNIGVRWHLSYKNAEIAANEIAFFKIAICESCQDFFILLTQFYQINRKKFIEHIFFTTERLCKQLILL